MVFRLSGEGSSGKNSDANAMANFPCAFLLLSSAVPGRRAPKLAGMPSKGDELYEARDLRIVPVDSPDSEVATQSFEVRPACEIAHFHSGDEKLPASPQAENRTAQHILVSSPIHYTQICLTFVQRLPPHSE